MFAFLTHLQTLFHNKTIYNLLHNKTIYNPSLFFISKIEIFILDFIFKISIFLILFWK